MEHPKLFQLGKNKEIRTWRVWTEGSKVFTEYGVEGGKLLTSCKTSIPRNIGKKNETTAEEQAVLDATSLYNHQLKRKYSLTKEEAELPSYKPMLAKEWKSSLNVEEWFFQPKLDGLRCLSYRESSEVKLMSRSGLHYTVPDHIISQLDNILGEDDMLDGELYIHGIGFQTLTSYSKKKSDSSSLLEYHIYDMPMVDGDSTLSFKERFSALLDISKNFHSHIKLVSTQILRSDPKVEESKSVKSGYEGLILRNPKGLYCFGHRSSDLLKVKSFTDDEFLIKDIIDGIGKFEGKAVFICKNNIDDQTFECSLAASMSERERIYNSRSNYIGKKLTVKFIGRTDGGIPKNPVGIKLRENEDLDQCE